MVCYRGESTVQWDRRRPPGCCDTEDIPEGTPWASADLQAIQWHCKLLLYVTITSFLHWNPFNLRGYFIWPGLYFQGRQNHFTFKVLKIKAVWKKNTYDDKCHIFVNLLRLELKVCTTSGLKKLRLMALYVFNSQLLPATVRWPLWRHWLNLCQKRTMNHCDISSHSLFRYSTYSLTVFSYCDYIHFLGNYTIIPSTAGLNCFVETKCTFTSFSTISLELGHFYIHMLDFFFFYCSLKCLTLFLIVFLSQKIVVLIRFIKYIYY